MYYSETVSLMLADGVLFDTEPEPRCEYRSPELDGGTGVGRMIQCRSNAAMWTDRGLRCDDHRRD